LPLLDFDTLERKVIDGEVVTYTTTSIQVYHEKHCPDENSTFTIREFIDWANDNKKMSSISSFTSSFENDPAKVIYIDSNRSKSDSNSNLQSK